MASIDANTVSAKGQLKPSQFVTFEDLEKDGIRILFVGNSITRHGSLPSIGWLPDHGMAASAKEKDYVHRVKAEVQNICPDAAFCICQVAEWERSYRNEVRDLSLFESARDFRADIIVMRLIENCTYEENDLEQFVRAYGELIDYLNPEGNAKILLTTGFWKHKGDVAIREYAKRTGLPLVELGDLGDMDEMKAIGLFEHKGVAAHPGDLGMEHIAKRIFAGIQEWL